MYGDAHEKTPGSCSRRLRRGGRCECARSRLCNPGEKTVHVAIPGAADTLDVCMSEMLALERQALVASAMEKLAVRDVIRGLFWRAITAAGLTAGGKDHDQVNALISRR